MFQLNLHARHHWCQESYRREIYFIKDAFMQALYEHDFATNVQKLTRKYGPTMCCCEANGCHRCDNLGWWYPEDEVYLGFVFSVNDKDYRWLIPQRVMGFSAIETLPEGVWDGHFEAEPIASVSGSLVALVSLVTWVTHNMLEIRKEG